MERGDQEVRLARVTAIHALAADILGFDLVPADRRPFAPFTAGSHIDVHAPNSLVRQYSLCGDPARAEQYRIAVKKEATGRGGSLSMHARVAVGDALAITGPRNYFPLTGHGGRSVFIAGGIGITPIFAMIQTLACEGRPWELHYCARSEAHAAFHRELAALSGGSVRTYFSERPTLDVEALLRRPMEDTHLYCCGPQGLMQPVADASADWPRGRVHFEYFSAPAVDWPENQPFEVELGRTGEVLTVPADRSILQVVRAHGIEVASACEEGVCGTCETRVLTGTPEHRDVLLSAEEKAAGCSMMICVSRSKTLRLVLDL